MKMLLAISEQISRVLYLVIENKAIRWKVGGVPTKAIIRSWSLVSRKIYTLWATGIPKPTRTLKAMQNGCSDLISKAKMSKGWRKHHQSDQRSICIM